MRTTQAPPRLGVNRLRVALCDTDFLMNLTAEAVQSATADFLGMGVRAYAAQHVFDELYGDDGHGHPTKWHKLSEQARESGADISAQDFRDVFEERLLPKLTFVRMGAQFSDHPLVTHVRTVRRGRWASDAPTAQLAVLLSRLRPVTYSHDQHLYKPGVAPRPAGLAAARVAEQQVAHAEYTEVGAAGLTVGSVAGVDYFARSAAHWVGAPTWLVELSPSVSARGRLAARRDEPKRGELPARWWQCSRVSWHRLTKRSKSRTVLRPQWRRSTRSSVGSLSCSWLVRRMVRSWREKYRTDYGVAHPAPLTCLP